MIREAAVYAVNRPRAFLTEARKKEMHVALRQPRTSLVTRSMFPLPTRPSLFIGHARHEISSGPRKVRGTTPGKLRWSNVSHLPNR